MDGWFPVNMARVGQNRMTVCMVITLVKITEMHRTYVCMIFANPTHGTQCSYGLLHSVQWWPAALSAVVACCTHCSGGLLHSVQTWPAALTADMACCTQCRYGLLHSVQLWPVCV
jgi:hypothetical protein